jgi:hypothetical protein
LYLLIASSLVRCGAAKDGGVEANRSTEDAVGKAQPTASSAPASPSSAPASPSDPVPDAAPQDADAKKAEGEAQATATPPSDALSSPTPPSDALSSPTPSLAPYAGGAVAVEAPSKGETVTGKTTIRLDPAQPAALAKVEVTIDGALVGTLTAAPFELAWDSRSAANGSHDVAGRAYDVAGAAAPIPALTFKTFNTSISGVWRLKRPHDAHTGFATNDCAETTLLVTYDPATSTVAFPSFYVTCYAQNGASYGSQVTGFTKTVAADEFTASLVSLSGFTRVDFSPTYFARTKTPFAGDTYTLSAFVERVGDAPAATPSSMRREGR